MAALSDIRSAMGTALAAVPNLRVRELIPSLVTPPMAVVQPSSIEYDLNAQNGVNRYLFTVTVFVVKADDRAAQLRVDPFVAPTGSGSIKAALEADRTLGGVVNTLRVTDVNNYSSADANDVIYLAVDFQVEVYA
ncbi:MAG TPA: hypothetical protein VIG24_10120 [Acidimicrobiia bacterium]